jgi:putative endonuclease
MLIPDLVQGVPFWALRNCRRILAWCRCRFALHARAGGEWFAMNAITKMRVGILERALVGMDRIAARRGRTAATAAHLLVGAEGEDAAHFYLRRKGFTVVARRWSAGNAPGDLDLIAWQGPMLCFIEVKTRTSRDMTPAEAAVDEHKRKTLRRLARQYIRQLPNESVPQARFDVISVYLTAGRRPEIEHFENAFVWQERSAR